MEGRTMGRGRERENGEGRGKRGWWRGIAPWLLGTVHLPHKVQTKLSYR